MTVFVSVYKVGITCVSVYKLCITSVSVYKLCITCVSVYKLCITSVSVYRFTNRCRASVALSCKRSGRSATPASARGNSAVLKSTCSLRLD